MKFQTPKPLTEQQRRVLTKRLTEKEARTVQKFTGESLKNIIAQATEMVDTGRFEDTPRALSHMIEYYSGFNAKVVTK